MSEAERCACGQPLHYRSPEVRATIERMIALLGPEVAVSTPGGAWWVPRHYIALHGLAAAALPELAVRLGFKPAPPDTSAPWVS
jgi:hypothetical protein